MKNKSVHRDGPTMAHKAGAFMIPVAASAAYVVTVLWPVVTRFV